MTRTFCARRRVRLSDVDPAGRLRLDAVARYLQDVAGDDVADAGWRPDEHVWIVRRSVVDVVAPFAGDEEVELVTWASGIGRAAAARRTTVTGDRGGRVEAESVWIHMDAAGRPLRLSERFLAVYGPSADGRRITPRLELPDPPADAERRPWPLRASDADLLGHVNNAAYWHAVEEVLAERSELAARPLHAVLEFRSPLDVADEAQLLVVHKDNEFALALAVGDDVRAVAELSCR